MFENVDISFENHWPRHSRYELIVIPNDWGEMVVTWEWIRLAFASFRSPEQTNLFPPSTAHRLVCAPASETAPVKAQNIRFIGVLCYIIKSDLPSAVKSLHNERRSSTG